MLNDRPIVELGGAKNIPLHPLNNSIHIYKYTNSSGHARCRHVDSDRGWKNLLAASPRLRNQISLYRLKRIAPLNVEAIMFPVFSNRSTGYDTVQLEGVASKAIGKAAL